ncbi:hypothetical protein CWI37_0866p0020 [Hamiltosporidium tvaerminnensis]|uniref:Uncharacterized protein n=2 Tax=Hamiltosporidium TaxID=1176354 RepID=A0A4Q9L2W3_9MICR|nr:p21-activated protein kinase-interacting protein 1-like protein [Hamiltosporidium tvaerminnensis]TBU00897.1 hypothetical protein CWI37_0866p0020 [Hamiltosporidium tvaerminnensis]TBU01365.1 hypothetical protein CWI39_1405p0010 [Hamiltosporidium magnivora]
MIKRPVIDKSKFYDFKHVNSCFVTNSEIISGSICNNTNIISLGSSNGDLKLFTLKNDKIENFCDLQFMDSPIFCVEWVNKENIALGLGTGQVLIYNVVTDTNSLIFCHEGSIRSIKNNFSREMIFTGSTDGSIKGWDLRTNKCEISLISQTESSPKPKRKNNIIYQDRRINSDDTGCINQRSTITAMEFINDYNLCSSQTPGSKICIWDLRYTKKGFFTHLSYEISRKAVYGILSYNNKIYCASSDGRILILRNDGTVSRILGDPNINSSYGNIIYDRYNDMILAGLKNRVFLINENNYQNIGFKMLELGNINGVISSNNNLITYGTSNNIEIYESIFDNKYNLLDLII